MAKGMPSLLALLGLAAVARFQNRDKLGEMLQGMQQPPPPSGPRSDPAGARGADSLSGGISALIERFQSAGHGSLAKSWVSTGPNTPVEPGQLEQALGADTIAELAQKTGLSAAELLKRLSGVLPEVVDRLTPDGHLASQTDAQVRT